VNNLYPFVKKELGHHPLKGISQQSDRKKLIQQIVLSWFVRYKYKISLIWVVDNATDISLQPNDTQMFFREKIDILVEDIDTLLQGADGVEVLAPDYGIIRTFPGHTILIQCAPPEHQPKRASYSIANNMGYTSLLCFVQKNTCSNATKWARQIVIVEWLRCYNSSIRYEGGAEPLPLLTAVQLLESSFQIVTKNTSKNTAVLDARFDSNDSNIHVNVRQLTTSSATSSVHSKVIAKRNRKGGVIFLRRTRSNCAQIANLLSSASKSKLKIEYHSDNRRHVLGQPPKLKPLDPLMFRKHGDGNEIDPMLIRKRIVVMDDLVSLHSGLVHLNILSPRDRWEEWIENFKHDKDCDPAFMCLLIIIMSSSTADDQLAHIVPRLFSCGLTSAIAVNDVVQQYGLNTLCSLLSETGRFYQNAERIINAADYFIQQHNGRIPTTISVNELCTLFGVGYKTANIVVTTAFGRVDGIPSDIHVIRWSNLLGWCPPNADGLQCSKCIEGWLPKSKWDSINPVFGAFGQLLISEKRNDLLLIASQYPSEAIRKLFRKAANVYKRTD
jgi:endonuclease III